MTTFARIRTKGGTKLSSTGKADKKSAIQKFLNTERTKFPVVKTNEVTCPGPSHHYVHNPLRKNDRKNVSTIDQRSIDLDKIKKLVLCKGQIIGEDLLLKELHLILFPPAKASKYRKKEE